MARQRATTAVRAETSRCRGASASQHHHEWRGLDGLTVADTPPSLTGLTLADEMARQRANMAVRAETFRCAEHLLLRTITVWERVGRERQTALP
jgi:hypothetical protein